MVRVFCYDFISDSVLYEATGNVVLNKNSSSTTVFIKTELVKASQFTTKQWLTKRKKLLAVSSVAQPKIGVLPTATLDFSKLIVVEAQTNLNNLNEVELLSVQWKYSLNGGEKKKFTSFEKSSHPGNKAVISFLPLPEWQGKELKVYAFFTSPSEKVMAKILLVGQTGSSKANGREKPNPSAGNSQGGLSQFIRDLANLAKDNCACSSNITKQQLDDFMKKSGHGSFN